MRLADAGGRKRLGFAVTTDCESQGDLELFALVEPVPAIEIIPLESDETIIGVGETAARSYRVVNRRNGEAKSNLNTAITPSKELRAGVTSLVKSTEEGQGIITATSRLDVSIQPSRQAGSHRGQVRHRRDDGVEAALNVVRIAVLLVASATHDETRIEGAAPEVNATEFALLAHRFFDGYRTFSFIYEGEQRNLVDSSRAGGESDGSLSMTYQATYAFRNDGATILDCYSYLPDGIIPHNRTTTAEMKTRREILYRTPDSPYPVVSVEKARDESFTGSGSPETFNYVKFFQRRLARFNPVSFAYEGWETVEGRQCLRCRIGLYPGEDVSEPGKSSYLRFWMDVGRGGHPVKVEDWYRNSLWARITVSLMKVPVKGEEMWFPVSAREESFIREDATTSDKPRVRVTYSVVLSSLTINESIPDELFTASYKGGVRETQVLAKARQDFQARLAQAGRDQMARQAVPVDLDERLAEADRQSAELDASAAASRTYSITTVVQIVCALIAVAGSHFC